MPSGTNNFSRDQDIAKLNVTLGNIDAGDTNEPYNYLEWRKRAGIIRPEQLFSAYNEYVRNWYNKRNAVKVVPTSYIIKQDYITLLKQLPLNFSSTAEANFLNNIDYNNDVELAIAIPFFAKQLKQIAVYLAEKRETVKATKLKYSMAGTKQAIEKILYQHVLTAFTKKNTITRVYDVDFYNSLPQLSAVNSYLGIEVEELYDTGNYFDSDTTVPVSAYTAADDYSFINSLMTSSLVSALNDTRNYDTSATDTQTKYLGLTHISVSADGNGHIDTQTVIDPISPYAHISNRYYATVASIPNLVGIKSQADLGGYFTFRSLGVSTYLAATTQYSYDLSSMVSGVVYTIPDPLYINHGRSLTLRDQTSIVIHEKNLGWVKARNTNLYQEGFIVNGADAQKFIPYQSRYETIGNDTQGVSRTTDRFDFWTGEFKDIWTEETTYPLTWRGEFNIASRTTQLQVMTDRLYNWTTDIFGNHFAIYKTLDDLSSYDKLNLEGSVWVRLASTSVYDAPTALSAVYAKYAIVNNTIYGTLSSNTIFNIDIIADMLIMEIDGYVLIEHLDYDYDTNQIMQGVNGNTILSLSGDNTRYGGFWYNEDEGTATFCILVPSISGAGALYYPELHKVDLATNISTQIFPLAGEDISRLTIPDSIMIGAWQRPVITYNKDTKTYNIADILSNGPYYMASSYLYSVDIIETDKYRATLVNDPILHVLSISVSGVSAIEIP